MTSQSIYRLLTDGQTDGNQWKHDLRQFHCIYLADIISVNDCEDMLQVCRGCINLVTGAECTSAGIGVNANLELVDKFCYLGDMVIADGNADAAVETRIQIRWNKFRQLVSLLTTHTHNCFTALLEYVRDHPGEQVPERKNQEG